MSAGPEWTADDVIAALYFAQAIPLADVDPLELELQRPAAIVMALVADARAVGAFADWFLSQHPEIHQFDARDLRRYWYDFQLALIRERHRRAA